MNFGHEIDRLRSALMGQNWHAQEIEEICDIASSDLNTIILDVVENAVAEAVDFAVSIGADEFMNDMDIIPDGSGLYRVWTKSGKTDFSREEQKMLPNLLKNGKTAKDGSRYKVIPVQVKEVAPHADMYAMMQARKQALDNARASLVQNSKDKRSVRANTMAETFRNSLSQHMSINTTETIKRPTGEPNFRTASSKQDPNTKWVIPGKDMDMTNYLHSLNDRIKSTIEDASASIIDGYYQEYVMG